MMGILRYFKKVTKGAALVEYMPLLAAMGVVLPTFIVFSSQIPELFEEPDPFTTPDIVITIPSCVSEQGCEIPEEVVTHCIETTTEGEVCDIVPYVVITPDPGTPVLVPVVTDPAMPWVMEDLDLGVYANSPSDLYGNHNDIVAFSNVIWHPAGMYCESRGGMLPDHDLMYYMMENYADELNLGGTYWTSSHYWAAGHYNPPPVLVTIDYAKTVAGPAGLQSGHGFLTHSFRVRCVYD